MARLCALYTGGKDSCYAMHIAYLQGFDIACLITLRVHGWSSLLFHYPHTWITRLHSRALRIPLLEHEVIGDEYSSLVRILHRARSLCGCRYISSGALLSDYQRLRFTMAAFEAGLDPYTPLWRKDQEDYMRRLVREGFRVLVISVQAYGLPSTLVGKVLDEELVEDIIARSKRYGFNPAFEGGEAETLVLDAPLFRERLVVKGRSVQVGPDHYVYEILDARLIPKNI